LDINREGAAMKKFLVSFVLLFPLLSVMPAFGFGGCEENCLKCHSLNKQEVQQIFVKLHVPDAQVIDIRMSPIQGLWEVSIENKGARGLMYVGFSKKYVISGPIFEVETASNKTQETLQKMNNEVPRYVETSAIPLDNALLLGQKDARYKVIVFTDPECPFCGKLHAELKKVIAESKDIAFYLKLMPLPMHPDARWKAQSILCAKSLQLLEDNFEKKPIPKPDCDSKDIDENIKLAQSLGITGTPTLVMPDGMVVTGGRDAKTIIDMVLHPPRKEK
jgi:thiol:disulfide interchange protein DsbC